MKQNTSGQPQEAYLKSLKAIDIGCGAGILSESLARLGLGSVTGVDPTDKCVHLAQEHLDKYSRELAPKIQYRNTTLETVLSENQKVSCNKQLILSAF